MQPILLTKFQSPRMLRPWASLLAIFFRVDYGTDSVTEPLLLSVPDVPVTVIV
jgi:hypothetical protein